MAIKYYRTDLNKTFSAPSNDTTANQPENTKQAGTTQATTNPKTMPGLTPQPVEPPEPQTAMKQSEPEPTQPVKINKVKTSPRFTAKPTQLTTNKTVEISNKPFLFNPNMYLKKVGDAIRAQRKEYATIDKSLKNNPKYRLDPIKHRWVRATSPIIRPEHKYPGLTPEHKLDLPDGIKIDLNPKDHFNYEIERNIENLENTNDKYIRLRSRVANTIDELTNKYVPHPSVPNRYVQSIAPENKQKLDKLMRLRDVLTNKIHSNDALIDSYKEELGEQLGEDPVPLNYHPEETQEYGHLKDVTRDEEIQQQISEGTLRVVDQYGNEFIPLSQDIDDQVDDMIQDQHEQDILDEMD